MLFQFLISCVAIPLLYSAGPANALYGPATAAAAGEFPQVVIVEQGIGATKNYISAAVLSTHFAIGSKQLSPSSLSQVKAYSGDLVNFGNALHQTVKVIINRDKFSIVKVCPGFAAGYSAVSLAEADNFNYQTNTTGKMLYFDETSQALKYRTASVLTDAACTLENQKGRRPMNYSTPGMTCTEFDNSDGSCIHMYTLTSLGLLLSKTFPILLIGSKTAAVLDEARCDSDPVDTTTLLSMITYHKLRNMRTDILSSSVVDFP